MCSINKKGFIKLRISIKTGKKSFLQNFERFFSKPCLKSATTPHKSPQLSDHYEFGLKMITKPLSMATTKVIKKY